MHLTYTPDGQPAQSWPVDLGRFRVTECEAIERRTGMSYGGDFKEKLLSGNVTARRALLWVLLRREHPLTRYEDVDFADDEVVLAFDLDEYREMRAATESQPGISDEQRAQALAVLDAEIAAGEAAAAAALDEPADQAEEAEGKAPCGSSSIATG